jgi:hypothetical protein
VRVADPSRPCFGFDISAVESKVSPAYFGAGSQEEESDGEQGAEAVEPGSQETQAEKET